MVKNKKDKFEPYFKTLKELAKKAPSDEKILSEFEQGDFSSVDSDFFKTGYDMAQKFLREKKNKDKVKKLRKKEPVVTV